MERVHRPRADRGTLLCQRRGRDSNPRDGSPRLTVFKTGRKTRTCRVFTRRAPGCAPVARKPGCARDAQGSHPQPAPKAARTQPDAVPRRGTTGRATRLADRLAGDGAPPTREGAGRPRACSVSGAGSKLRVRTTNAGLRTLLLSGRAIALDRQRRDPLARSRSPYLVVLSSLGRPLGNGSRRLPQASMSLRIQTGPAAKRSSGFGKSDRRE